MKGIENIGIQQQTFFYRLLMSPKAGYRISRHLLLILGLLAISFNSIYMGFMEYSSLMGNYLYVFTLFLLTGYLLQGYFNIYVLIPRLFLKKRYTAYFITFSCVVFLFVCINYSIEYLIYRWYDLTPGTYSYFQKQGMPFLLELLASYFIDYIAILGAGLTVILKHWLINDEQVHRLEQIHMQTEVEKLKEQVNPQFFFSILHRIGDIAPREQQKASDMLMDLSEILRYQLYDSGREKVLLNAEIQFVETYLKVEQLHYGEQMNFRVESVGDVNRVFVPPLLFLPLIQNAVKSLQKEGGTFTMLVSFRSEDNHISFSCDCRDRALLASPDMEMIRRRLERLFPKRYILAVETGLNMEYPILSLSITQ